MLMLLQLCHCLLMPLSFHLCLDLAAELPPVPEPDLAITDATVENMFNGADEMLDAGEALLMFASINEAM
jgi:hypothetical protein